MSRFCGVKISGSISEKVQQMIDACINAEGEKYKLDRDRILLDVKLGLNSNNSISK